MTSASDDAAAEPSVSSSSEIDAGAVGSVGTVEESPEEQAVELDLAALLSERDQFKDIALRLQADFENYRKRVQRDTADEVDRRAGRLVESLRAVLDACEAAFAHGAEGVEPIWASLIGVLSKQGLEAMDCAGKEFDPSEHEAVVHEPAPDGDHVGGPVVAEVLRTGYRWQGKVLRPAMVKVRG